MRQRWKEAWALAARTQSTTMSRRPIVFIASPWGWGEAESPPQCERREALPVRQHTQGRGRAGTARAGIRSVKQADKRDSVTALAGYDDHSSRPGVAAGLEPPTRRLGGPRRRLPTWCC